MKLIHNNRVDSVVFIQLCSKTKSVHKLVKGVKKYLKKYNYSF